MVRSRSSLWSIVLAGGKGRRLEAAARRYHGSPLPKQFCTFGGDRSLLQRTLLRTLGVASPLRTVLVVDRTQTARAEAQIGRYEGVAIVEQPCDRGTAMGVLLPLVFVLQKDPNATVLLTPSDHGIGDEAAFRESVRGAHRAVDAGVADWIVFGVEADAPRTDYGWILPGPEIGHGIRAVKAFSEKPPAAAAEEFLRRGALWNTMVLVASASALYTHFSRRFPRASAALGVYSGLPFSVRRELLLRAYERLEPADFSRDILGCAPGLAVCSWSASMGWTDLGTPERLEEWIESSERPGVSAGGLV